jgi:hypothetical protein
MPVVGLPRPAAWQQAGSVPPPALWVALARERASPVPADSTAAAHRLVLGRVSRALRRVCRRQRCPPSPRAGERWVRWLPPGPCRPGRSSLASCPAAPLPACRRAAPCWPRPSRVGPWPASGWAGQRRAGPTVPERLRVRSGSAARGRVSPWWPASGRSAPGLAAQWCSEAARVVSRSVARSWSESCPELCPGPAAA